MKAKHAFVFLVTLMLLIPVYIFAVQQLQQRRTLEKRGLNLRSLPLPVNFYYVAAGEFAGLIADFLYLDMAATLGGRESAILREDEWDRVEKTFATAVRLDPYFEPTFRAIQAYLPWSAKRPVQANALLEQVSEKRSWHWMPPFFIGFNHYFFLKDNAKASHAFIEAAGREYAPPMLATLGARLAAETGNAAIGINLLQRLMTTTEDPHEKRMFQQRIEALQGLYILEGAIATYRRDYGTNPPFLLALIVSGYLNAMPRNPYHSTFFYKEGIVRFDPFPPARGGRALSDQNQDKADSWRVPLLLDKQIR